MWKVTITSNDGRMWENRRLATSQAANEWLQAQIGKPGRRDAYWTEETPADWDGSNYNTRIVDNPTGPDSVEYEIPAEFTSVIEDISAQTSRRDRISALLERAKERKRAIEFGQAVVFRISEIVLESNADQASRDALLGSAFNQALLSYLNNGWINDASALIASFDSYDTIFSLEKVDELRSLLSDYISEYNP